MPAPSSPLLAAVSAYKKAALAVLPSEQVPVAIGLLKEVNRHLGGTDLLAASGEEVRAAATKVAAGGRADLLTAELRRFYDTAFTEGLILVHPLTGEARLPQATAPPPGRLSPEQVATQAAKVVANVIEDAVRTGLMLSPLALPVAEASSTGTFVDRLLAGASERWQRLAWSLHPVLDAARFVVPLAAIVLALVAALGGGNPLSVAANESFATGQAVRELEIAIQLLGNQEMQYGPIASLSELGERVGVRFGREIEVFDAERISNPPPLIMVRHRPSGAVVVLTPDYRVVYRQGRVTVKAL